MKYVGFGMTVQDKNAKDLVPLYNISNDMDMEFATASLHNSFYFVEAKNIIHDRPMVAQNFEDLINERLEALDEIDVVDSNNVNTVIRSKVNEQNNKVEFSRKKQELIKILDKFKRINPNISYDENMDVKELERIITEINI